MTILLTVFLYWFSAQQKQALTNINAVTPIGSGPYALYVKTSAHKTIEYTECRPQSKAKGKPLGRFTDYKLVATLSGGGCSSARGEW